MFVPDRIYCMSGSCRVCCRRERSCVSPDWLRCWRSCCSRDTGAALWDEPPGCAAGVHRGMRNSPDISDSHEALWGLTMTWMLSRVNDDRFVVTSIHFHYFIVDWTVILCENQVTFTCGCSYYESAADGQTAHWPVWSPSHILCRRTVYLLCACGRDASVRWTARTRPSSTGSSTFYLQIKFSQIRQQPYAEQPTWNKTHKTSAHPRHVSFWCGMTERRPQRSSCRSVCNGTVSLPCADACGSWGTRWRQTWPRIPRTHTASLRNVRCAYDKADL